MDWQQYEREIEGQFRDNYPSAQITHNAKLMGRFSKVERQIDILIEEQASDFAFRIVVDAKHRGRRIDVSDVESFIGLARDVDAHTGMLVALEGYTPAAVNRAHNDDLDIILDVLNMEELRAFQGLAAIPYSGDRGVSIAAPFGWVIDATRRPNMAASLYQRGKTFEEAVRSDEWMYVNFWIKKADQVDSLDDLLEYQAAYILEGAAGARIDIVEQGRNQRLGVRTLVRRLEKRTYAALEYTGFVDFEDFILMCVLFTPRSLERKNLRKLRFILRDAFPVAVTHDHKARISAAEAKLRESSSVEEKAQLLAKIGFWRREMGDLQNSKRCLEESISLLPNQDYAQTQLLRTLIKLGDRDAMLGAMSRLVRLDPHNPRVFDYCIDYTKGGPVTSSDALSVLEGLKGEYSEDHFVRANCDFYSGKILIETDPIAAKGHFAAAEVGFQEFFPPEHQVFTAIRNALIRLSKKNP